MGTYRVGFDECGRGSLAGPLVGCAFAEEIGVPLEGVKDSKKFGSSEAGRRRLREVAEGLEKRGHHFRIEWAWPETIDHLGIDRAWEEACRGAVAKLVVRLVELGHDVEEVVVDGKANPLHLGGVPARALVGADATVPAVSAASILAKSKQLKYMADMELVYPQYGFGKGAGYGTKVHLGALATHGHCPIHRRSFEPVKSLQKVLAVRPRLP